MAEPEVEVAAAAEMETEAPAAAGQKREREEGGDPAAEGVEAADEEAAAAAAKKPRVEEDTKEEKEEETKEEKEGEEAKGKPVKLGPKEFATAVEMFDYFFALLHSWSPQLDFNKYEQMVLEDLLKKGHAEPAKKIGSGIEAFEIRNHPVWQSRCFFVRRVDGSADDFSFRKCVDSILPLPEDMKVSAEEFTAKTEALQSERMAMEHKLKTADRELIKLTNKVSLLHREIEQERLLSEEYEQKCQRLEAQLSRDSRDAKLWRLANSNGDLKTKKEKELANAAGKLAECQKTIASLEHQLKSLTDLDSMVLEPERLESSRDTHIPLPLDFRNGDAEFMMFTDDLYDFDLPISNTSCFSPLPSIQPSSPPPSEMSVFAGGLSTLSSYRSKRASRR